MAQSTCIKCGSIEFEAVLTQFLGADKPAYFCQCARCGGVISILPVSPFDLEELLETFTSNTLAKR